MTVRGVPLMFSIRTSSTSWPEKQRISILEKDEIDKAEDLNKNVSGWEEKKRNSWVYRKSDLWYSLIDHSSLKATFWLLLLVITWLLTYFSEPFFFVSVHWNLFRFNEPQPLRKQLDEYFPFFSRSGTTFENTVRESSPQNGSTRGLNLMLIVIVLLAIFILAIAVVFGISFFRRHQSHKNQGKFLV